MVNFLKNFGITTLTFFIAIVVTTIINKKK